MLFHNTTGAFTFANEGRSAGRARNRHVIKSVAQVRLLLRYFGERKLRRKMQISFHSGFDCLLLLQFA